MMRRVGLPVMAATLTTSPSTPQLRYSATASPSSRRRFTVEDVLAGKSYALAKAITLVESSRPGDAVEIANVLRELHSRRDVTSTGERELTSMRIAISGSPGSGKSCFIEALGCLLATHYNLRVGVIAVDPSSTVSGGSILGDKTRMERLGTCDNAFVRPSPSRGHLGGVTARCWESMEILEAASFDVVLVETVGVGQSEVAARDMSDLFVLLVPPASGDELQGIKKGIVEVADMVIVTKNDGSNDQRLLAQQTKAAYTRAVMFQRNYHNFKGAYSDMPTGSPRNSGAHRRSKANDATMMEEQVIESLPTPEETIRIEKEAREDALGDSLKPVLAISTFVDTGVNAKERPIKSIQHGMIGEGGEVVLTNPSIDAAWRRLQRMWDRRKASGQLRLLRKMQTLDHFNEYFNEELKVRARVLLEGGIDASRLPGAGNISSMATTAADPNVRRILSSGLASSSSSMPAEGGQFHGLLTALEDAVVRRTMAPREAGDVAIAIVLGHPK